MIKAPPYYLSAAKACWAASTISVRGIALKKTANNTPLYLRDVAEVDFGHATRFGAMTYNDQGELAGVVVMMLKGANNNQVIKEVKARIAQINRAKNIGLPG